MRWIRTAWCLIALSVVTIGGGKLWLNQTPFEFNPSSIPPVAIPDLSRWAVPKSIRRRIPSHNLFSANGEPWARSPSLTRLSGGARGNANLNSGDIKGILRIETVAGVLTADGFVREGAQLQGQTLKSVSPDGATFSADVGSDLLLRLDWRQRQKSMLSEVMRIAPVEQDQ